MDTSLCLLGPEPLLHVAYTQEVNQLNAFLCSSLPYFHLSNLTEWSLMRKDRSIREIQTEFINMHPSCTQSKHPGNVSKIQKVILHQAYRSLPDEIWREGGCRETLGRAQDVRLMFVKWSWRRDFSVTNRLVTQGLFLLLNFVTICGYVHMRAGAPRSQNQALMHARQERGPGLTSLILSMAVESS